MRLSRLLAVALLLAGCGDRPDAELPDLAADGGDPAAVAPTVAAQPLLRRMVESWSNATYASDCQIDLEVECVASSDEDHEYRFSGVAGDLWLNVTWESNDAANEDLTVTIEPRRSDAEAMEFRGESPLVIHLPVPPVAFTFTIEGQRTELLVGYREAPPQPFEATASYLTR